MESPVPPPADPSDGRSVDADLLRLIVDLAPEGILVATPAGHFCVVNPTAGALLGYDPPALRGHTWQDLIVGEARPTDLPPGPIQRQECRLRHQDGHELTVIISSRRLPDGRVLHMLHDLTARAQEEARLRASEARYRTLAEAAEDSIFLINPDETVQYVNPAGARFIALTPDTIVGRRYAEFFPPASAEAQRRHIQQVFATGLPHTDEFVVPTAQGDLWMSATLVPLTTPAGSIAGVLGTARDITARKRAEEALRLSEARFASIFHASPVGICLTRLADGTLIDLNEAFAQMMGYPRGQILGRTTTDLQLWANPTDRDGLVTLVQAQGRVANRELPFRRHSGALGRALASAELITVGAEQYLLCLLIDITAQKQAEDALRQSEARFRTVVTHAQPIIFLIDHDGTFLLSEGKMLAALGLRPGEVVGESAFVRYRDYPAILHGLRTALAGAHYEDTIDVGGVIFDIFYTPHRDADGVVLGAIGMAVDLTARTRAEAQARAQATRLAVLAEASHAFSAAGAGLPAVLERIVRTAATALGAACLVQLVAEQGAWLRPAAAFDADPTVQDLALTTLAAIPLTEDAPSLVQTILQGGAGALIPTIAPEQLRTLTPHTLWPLLEHVPVRSLILVALRVQGQVLGLLSLARHHAGDVAFDQDDFQLAQDLADRAALALSNAQLFAQAQAELVERTRAEAAVRTLNTALEQRVAARTVELAEANQRLEELNAFKDTLLAMASHDLRSPLGFIQNVAELLREEPALTDRGRDLVGQIARATHQMRDLVSKLLDLARLETGQLMIERLPVLVSDIARQVAEALRYAAEAKGQRIELIVVPGEVPIWADGLRLYQVLSNLLSNAIKFTHPGGQITVVVAQEPAGMGVRVADTGLGIPAEALPHLFEKFRQVHQRGTADEYGSGLGLAIVCQLVALHGGEIEVASTVGRGSTFTVHLPIGAASPPQDDRHAERA